MWWNNAKKAAAIKLGRNILGTFHDIKAKAISDYEGSSKDEQLFSGHKTETLFVPFCPTNAVIGKLKSILAFNYKFLK